MVTCACIRWSVRRLAVPSYRTSLRCPVSTSCTVWRQWNRSSCILMSYKCFTKSFGRQAGRQAAFSFQLLSLDSPRIVICSLECPVKCERHTKFSFHVNLVLRVERRLAFRKCNTTFPTDRQI